jgi:hypothetical protein
MSASADGELSAVSSTAFAQVLDQQFTRRWRRQCVGGTLILRGQLEQVAAAIFVGLARGCLGELVRAVAKRSGAAGGVAIGRGKSTTGRARLPAKPYWPDPNPEQASYGAPSTALEITAGHIEPFVTPGVTPAVARQSFVGNINYLASISR